MGLETETPRISEAQFFTEQLYHKGNAGQVRNLRVRWWLELGRGRGRRVVAELERLRAWGRIFGLGAWGGGVRGDASRRRGERRLRLCRGGLGREGGVRRRSLRGLGHASFLRRICGGSGLGGGLRRGHGQRFGGLRRAWRNRFFVLVLGRGGSGLPRTSGPTGRR